MLAADWNAYMTEGVGGVDGRGGVSGECQGGGNGHRGNTGTQA